MSTLLAWHGADAPIPEVEILAMATTLPGLSAMGVIAFLADQHLLVATRPKQHDLGQQRVERAIEALPAAFVDDVRPVLHTWHTEVDGFREIIRGQVTSAIKQRKGNVARGAHVGLSSLFRALMQERVIFRGPATGAAGGPVSHVQSVEPEGDLRW